jgi:hypothetical protein
MVFTREQFELCCWYDCVGVALHVADAACTGIAKRLAIAGEMARGLMTVGCCCANPSEQRYKASPSNWQANKARM